MGKDKTIFVCSSCGYESAKWLGKCPACNEWNSFYEEVRRILFYYPTKDRRIWKESYKLYRKFYAEAKRRMNPGMRLLLKYIYCIETPFCEKGASFMKKKKKRRK